MQEEGVVRIRSVKPEIRVLGVDDGIFAPHTKGMVDIVGVVYRGGYWLDGVMRTKVIIDGMDATEKIASMIIKSPHYDQLRVVMLNGITFAGFNVVDIKELHKKLGLPIIAVTRERPDLEEIRRALMNLSEFEKRWEAIRNAGETIKVHTREAEEPIYMQIVGILERDAEKILRNTSTRSNIPEALRVAHIIASGLAQLKEA
ncbi:MAG: hypothetical protein AOA65_2298 [Candidatus Bathyarchaeota archaeon BA1]|nr:MAG: hypothetical protein AOA65_2298 [Candidatus Bathyarchaeota archaeon BA1]